ncbi:hypothetical protein cypCar_00034723, partial [Cyprinus carpio]
DCFEDAFDRIPVASTDGSAHVYRGVQHGPQPRPQQQVLCNSAGSAQTWCKDSMYHALGYSSILVMQATMTFEHKDIQAGMTTIKEALQTCQRCGSNTRRFPTRSASDLCPVCPQVQETKLGGGVHLQPDVQTDARQPESG